MALSRATGYGRDYTHSPYENYAQSKKLYFPVPRDRRYHPKMLTLGVRVPGEAPRAYPSAEIERSGGSLVEKIGTGEISITYDSKRALFRADAPEGWELIVGYWFAWAAFHPDTTVFVFEPGRANPD